MLYERNPKDLAINPEATKAVYDEAVKEFGTEAVRYDEYRQKGGGVSFPVFAQDGRIISSLALSEVLNKLPVFAIEYVFISPEFREKAEEWLVENRDTIIAPVKEEE